LDWIDRNVDVDWIGLIRIWMWIGVNALMNLGIP